MTKAQKQRIFKSISGSHHHSENNNFQLNNNRSNLLPNYEIGKVIGTGTFGKVREAIYVPTNQKVAIKILQKNKIIDHKDLQRIERQLIILKSINHQNILKLRELHQTKDKIFIVTELVQGQELYERIIKKGKLSVDQSCEYFTRLVRAAEYLHKKKICHRDIKPENIIVDVQNKKLKLIDFGLSNKFDQNPYMKTSCGSPCYAAPQMLTGKRYDPIKSDIWAMGITLYAMLAGQLPFQHQNTDKLYKMIKNGQYEQISKLPTYLKLLIRSMIQPNPTLRASIEQIKQNIWIKEKLENLSSQDKDSQLSQQYQIHDGGFHIKYVFRSMEAIIQFIQRKNEEQLKKISSENYDSKNENKKLLQMDYQMKLIGNTEVKVQNKKIKDLNQNDEEITIKIKKLRNMPNLLYFPYDYNQ